MGVIENIDKREYCGYGYYSYRNDCYYRSNWYYWGRWVVVGVILLVLFLTLMCLITARRRRGRGQKPYYGTGWMATGKQWGGHNNPNHYNNYNMNGYGQQNTYQGNYNPPPAYGVQQQQYTGSTFNPNEGYYGQQQTGVQSPPNAYTREGDYAPPAGPPPGK